MIKIWAKTLSGVFIPLMIPTYLSIIILFFFPFTQLTNVGIKVIFLGYVFFTTALLPVLAILLTYKMKIIKDFTLNERADRLIPQGIILLIYVFFCYMLYRLISSKDIIFVLISGISVCMLVITIITAYWKISAHSAGMFGMAGALLALSFKYHLHEWQGLFIGVFLVSSLVVSSRLYLNIHTPMQVLTGSLLGFVFGYGTVLFFA